MGVVVGIVIFIVLLLLGGVAVVVSLVIVWRKRVFKNSTLDETIVDMSYGKVISMKKYKITS